MCDIEKISREKDNVINDINDTLSASGAIVVRVEKQMERLSQMADDNIRRLSFLL
jgi:hypothetical protein